MTSPRKRKKYRGQYDSVTGNSRPTHILIAEKALGYHLPSGVHVHHVNENTLDNSPGNLVVCPDAAYHMLLHRRTDALNACGNANWRKCGFCKQYDDPVNLSIKTRKVRGAETPLVYHKHCNNTAAKTYRETRIAA